MHREALLSEKHAEARRLAARSFSEVTPSRRDFTQFVATQKSRVALVPRLARADPEIDAVWPDGDLAALARVCDAAEIGALAVRTAAFYGGRPEDLVAIAGAVTAPILHDDLCLHRGQVYQSRLHGADALVLPADALGAEELGILGQLARSLHMAVVIEICEERDLRLADDLSQACIGIRCPAVDGFADLERVRQLATTIPRRRTVLLLSEVRSLDRLAVLDGLIDAAVVGKVLLDAPDPAALLEGFLGANG